MKNLSRKKRKEFLKILARLLTHEIVKETNHSDDKLRVEIVLEGLDTTLYNLYRDEIQKAFNYKLEGCGWSFNEDGWPVVKFLFIGFDSIKVFKEWLTWCYLSRREELSSEDFWYTKSPSAESALTDIILLLKDCQNDGNTNIG